MKRLSVNVPPELHREAKLIAHLEDETLSSMVLRLLRKHVQASQTHYEITYDQRRKLA
jgi:predicted HicB family RNase H-like nuclease